MLSSDKEIESLTKGLHKYIGKDKEEYWESREKQHKERISVHCRDNKDTLNKKKREMTCCVQSRWYRAPEVILAHPAYGKPSDIWSLGVIFSEMLTCSQPYTVLEDFKPSKRYLFKGKHCHPISPANPSKFKSEEMLERSDQLVKILHRYESIDTDKDLSFLTDDTAWKYAMKSIETSKI